MLYKIGYWNGTDDGKELDLVTEFATTSPFHASEFLHGIAHGIEDKMEQGAQEETTQQLLARVDALSQMLKQTRLKLAARAVAEGSRASGNAGENVD